MMLDTATLQRLGLDVSPDEFLRLVQDALEQFLPPRRDTRPAEDLTPDERRLLEEAGVSLEPLATGADSPLARTAAEYVALLASSLSVAAAAERLGVDASRVRQRLGAHTLYGIRQPAGWRLPLFQFTERGVLPGFDRVAPRLVGVHPVAVARWFTAPHVDLVVDDQDTPVPPRAWLETGRDPEVVADLADELRGIA